ncbi:MAG TPA: DEAD/DEAH box helicase [Polyangiaceae bacterium]|nr:DEAD/DEAH box helicase [Polyangiaceae bacterium]
MASSLSLIVRPSGLPDLIDDSGVELAPEVATRIRNAFGRGPFHGVLHLGAVETETALPATLAYARALARQLVASLCAIPDLETHRDSASPPCPEAAVQAMAASVPPMAGGEYVDELVLRRWWEGLVAAAREQLVAHPGPVEELLRAWNPVWNLVGRVWFHLAENKKDPTRPFAFLATYTSTVGEQSRPQHVPLGKALVEYAGDGARGALLNLLAPLHRAAEKSELVRRLVDSGEVFHPIAWEPREALAFLRELPLFEASGILVRVPDWWNARRHPRPSVRVTLGAGSPAGLGAEAMLDFALDVSLGGESLTRQEWESISRSTDGLVLLKGRWVEVDRGKLDEVLKHWKRVEREVAEEGVTFFDALRMMASGGRAPGAADGDGAEGWVEVEAGEWLTGVLERLRSPDRADGTEPWRGLKASLRPYQQVGVRWLETIATLGLGGCLADDMGLGKTLQVLGLLMALRREPSRAASLLVAPASLLANWRAEIARFAPDLIVRVAHASAGPEERIAGRDGLGEVDLVMTTYGSVHRTAWLREASWRAVVLDEAQAIKNPGARQTRAVKELKARTRLCLTGTPVENRLMDLWSLFDYAMPGLLGSSKRFTDETRRMEKAGSYASLRRLVGPYILRRLKTDPKVIADLPDKTELTAYCGLTRVQAVLYQKAVEELRDKLDDVEGMERRGAILAYLLRLKQICNHPSQWLGDGAWSARDSGKMERLAGIAEQVASRQEKMLVFTQFRETTAPLHDLLSGVFGRQGLVLHGQVPVRKRMALVDDFQREDGAPFFVLSLKAGGSGLNLTAASHVVHFDRWWNPAVENQATDRAFRIGQKRNVLVHKLVCKGTVEERIDALIAAKRELAEQVVSDGAEKLLTEMTNDELLGLVALDIGSVAEEPE